MNKLYFKNYKNSNGNLELNFLNFIKNKFNVEVFIETGTYNGETVAAANSVFNEIYSIELDKKMFEEASEKFKDNKNVFMLLGSSNQILNQILPSIKKRPVFWLDAHYCGENTAFGDSMTPIKEELEAIKNSNLSDCVIMIDDIRIFGSQINNKEYFVCNEYPTIQWVNDKLMEINKNFIVYLIGDILLAYDNTKFNIDVSDIVKACTISRLYDGINYSLNELLDAESKIVGINDEEFKIINSIANDQKNLEFYTTEFHYYLWQVLKNKNFNYINKIIENCYNNIIIDSYQNMLKDFKMNNKELYNEIYSKNNHYNHNVMYKYVEVSKFAKSIKGTIENPKILDAGCGEGWNLNNLINEGFDTFGIEISDVCCDQFLQKLPHKCTDIISYSKENIKYDALICFDVLEHISYDEIDETITALSTMAPNALIGIANHSDIQFGHELHLIQQNEKYWEEKLLKLYKDVKFIANLGGNFYLFECKV